MMCLPSCKTLFIFGALSFTIGLLIFAAGPSIITVPMQKIEGLLPKPHLSIKFGAIKGAPRSINYVDSYQKGGFDVEIGKMVSLSKGTCTQCMGSKSVGTPHWAVSFVQKGGTTPDCNYNNTEYGTCIHLDKNEAIMIFTEGPTTGVFDAFSWGVYLFDRFDTGGRDLIQAPLYDPIRLQRPGPTILIASYLPELSDALIASIDLPDVDPTNIHILPVPGDIVQTGFGSQNNDRLAILLKSEAKHDDTDFSFADTVVLKLKISDRKARVGIRSGATYSHGERLGYLSGKISSEKNTFTYTVEQVISDMKTTFNVASTKQMSVLRDILGTKSVQNCIDLDFNCLAEDWDVSFSVSGPLVFPDPSNYKVAIVGVNHSEAQLTTLGLFDATTNQEVIPLRKLDSEGGIYLVWIARNCSTTPAPCTEVPHSVAPNATPLFLRERVYGVHSYDNLVAPFVLQIKQ